MGQYDDLFNQAAKQYNIDPNLLRAVAQTESSMNPNASSGQANGLMQLTPATAQALGVTDPNDPAQAIPAAAKLLRQSLDANNGDIRIALMNYHGGPNTAIWGPKTMAYPGTVTTHMAADVQDSLKANDPLYAMLNGSNPAAKNSSPAPAPAQNNGDDFYNFLASGGKPGSAITQSSAPQVAPSQQTTPAMAQSQQQSDQYQPSDHDVPVVDAALHMLTGMVAKPVSDIAGLAARGVEMATGNQNPGSPEAFKNYVQDALTSNLHSKQAENIAKYNPLSMIGQGWGYIGQGAGNLIKSLAPDSVPAQMAGNAVGEAIPQLVNILGAKAAAGAPETSAEAIPERIEPTLEGQQSSGSAMTAESANPIISAMNKPRLKLNNNGSVTPIEQQMLPSESSNAAVPAPATEQAASAMPTKIDPVARINEAQSLPVPVNLTEGQALGDVNRISFEQNNRAALPGVADRFNQQNTALAQNFDAIRNQVAPNIPQNLQGTDLGQMAVDAYKKMDVPAKAQVTANYNAIAEANGGNLPVDGKAFASNVAKDLGSGSLVSNEQFLPAQIKTIVDKVGSSDTQMTINDWQNLQKIVSNAQRAAQKSGDGNAAYALNVVRDNLENIPMSSDAANLKPLLDTARLSAKTRFDAINHDPAYKAAINDGVPIGEQSPLADNFFKNYITRPGAPTAYVQNMMSNLSGDPLNKEIIAAGVMDELKKNAIGTSGNVSQNGLNGMIGAMDKKLPLTLGDTAQTVQSLGNVARYTQVQPRGSSVNNSNTFVASLGNHAASTAEGIANVAAHGVPVGTWVKNALIRRSQGKMADRILNPDANKLQKAMQQ